MRQNGKVLTLRTLSKNNIWDIQENDVFRLLEMSRRDIDFRENLHRYQDIIKSAFDVEEIKVDNPKIVEKYKERGFNVGLAYSNDDMKVRWAIKKRPIKRVTDLTHENINCISAANLIEILGRNFGGGWDSLSQGTKDIIFKGFEISTTTLPKDRLHKVGGMYDKKMNDGYDVLEVQKGTWVEAVFAKKKVDTLTIKGPNVSGIMDDSDGLFDNGAEGQYNETYNNDMTEESYRTTYDTEDAEDLNIEAEDVTDDDDMY